NPRGTTFATSRPSAGRLARSVRGDEREENVPYSSTGGGKMKVVDDVGLPEPILRAIQNDPYSRGESDISVTGLIKPPLMRALEDYRADEIEEKASGRIYALLGKAVHAILEMAQLDDE